MAATYVDSSAIVKLCAEEPESPALRRHLRRFRPLVSSDLARTEVLRALLLEGDAALARGRAALARFDLLKVSRRVLELAGTLLPAELRSLDAIHLASARLLGGDLGEVVAYDQRLLRAAEALGMRASSPS